MATGPQESSFSKGESQISPIPIAYFFMLSTKSFIQTTSWTYSSGRFGRSSGKKEMSLQHQLFTALPKKKKR